MRNVADVTLDEDSYLADVVGNNIFDDPFEELQLDAIMTLEIEFEECERGVTEGEEARDEFGETLESPEVGGVQN